MGMDRIVEFTSEAPSWESLRDFLVGRGMPLQLRMIDGQLAFPDEAPPENWTELRVGTPHGMVTMRRQGNGLTFVTWGNADAGLTTAWNTLAWAAAMAGSGRVQYEGAELEAEEFAKRVGLREPAL